MFEYKLKIYNISLKTSIIATALWSGILAVMLTDIIDSYSLPATMEGLMSSTISFGALTALAATIVFQGRFKKTQIIILCGFIASTALIIQGLPMPFIFFLAACFVMGFGHGAVDASQSAFLADLNPVNTAAHMGALHGIFGIGGVLTPIILRKLLEYVQWRTIYIIVGIVCMLLIAQFAVITRSVSAGVSVASRVESRLTASALKEFFGNGYCYCLMLCIFFGAAAQSGIIVWTIRYISVFLGSPWIAAVCLSAFWITSTASRFLSPLLPARPSRIMAYGAFISAVAWTVALFYNQPLSMFLACVITGLASGSCIPLSLSEGTAMHPDKTGFSTSVLMISKTVGQALSPAVVALAMSLSDMRTGMYITSIFFIINAFFAAILSRQKQASNNS